MIDFYSPNNMLPEKPFKLCTTSFIFPDNIIPNVKKLGTFFDEIELLVFESQPKEVLPSKDDVNELKNLATKYNITYNIHLPVDVSLTSDSHNTRVKSIDTILKVMELFLPVTPSTYTLHLDMPSEIKIKSGIANHDEIKRWQERTRQSLEKLSSKISNPESISIETLDYPFELVESFIEGFNLSVCIDAGHQIKYGYDLLQTFNKHKSRTSVIHLHGVDFSTKQNNKQPDKELQAIDHTSLDKLPKQYFTQLQTILTEYDRVVSLEVFNLENLNKSLFFLQKMFSG